MNAANHTAQPLDVYLDQSVYSRMVSESASDWRASKVGAVVHAAQSQGSCRVWASPTHVIETVQLRDVELRRSIAGVILDIIECRRMAHGHDAETVMEFFEFLEQFAPKSVNKVYFNHHANTARQLALAALAIIAATGAIRATDIIDGLIKHKAINRLYHARWAANPGGYVESMIDALENYRVVPESLLEDFSKRELADIEAEISGLEAQVRSVATEVRKKLNNNRERLARVYGAVEVGKYLAGYLPLPMEVLLTFGFPAIIAAWPKFMDKLKVPPLPKEVVEADHTSQVASEPITTQVLQRAIRASARAGLVTATVGYEVMLRELQIMANQGAVPKGSLSFDADHAAALKHCHVVVTHDIGLAASLRTISNKWDRVTNGKWKPQVCENAKQVREALLR